MRPQGAPLLGAADHASCLLVPAHLQLGREPLEVLARRRGQLDRALDAPAEALGRRPQRQLGVGAHRARGADGREEHVAQLARPRVLAQLGRLLVELGEGGVHVGEVEPGGRGALLGLGGVGERREPGRQVVEEALVGALLALAALPDVDDATGRLGDRVAVDVGVARDELVGLAARDARQVGGALLLEELRQEDRLEEQVADLVGQAGAARGDRVGHLEGLLDRVRHDRRGRLLAVPGAVAPQPQADLGEGGHLGPDGAGAQRLAGGQGLGVRQRLRDAVGGGVRGHDGRAVGAVGQGAEGRGSAPRASRSAGSSGGASSRAAAATASSADAGTDSGAPGPRATTLIMGRRLRCVPYGAVVGAVGAVEVVAVVVAGFRSSVA